MNNQINQNRIRRERPDKPLFFAMAGVFFLLFAIAPAYWAVYNYGEYNLTKAFVQDLKTKPDQLLTPDEKKEKENRIFFSSSRADRYRLEMLLSGAGSLILFASALLFFRKSFSASKRKNFYEKVDPRTIPMPTAPIKVQHKIVYVVMFWLIVSLFGGMFLFITYQNFSSRFIAFENAVIRTFLFGVPIILFLSVFIFLMLRAGKNVVRLIDNSGVTRGDGRHFAWQDFCGVISQTAFNQRTQRRYLWRTELAFENGETAWIIPNRVKNYDEISAFLDTLPRANLKNTV